MESQIRAQINTPDPHLLQFAGLSQSMNNMSVITPFKQTITKNEFVDFLLVIRALEQRIEFGRD
jgi:hypothetical protein